MMSVLQPFISGEVRSTVVVQENSTPEDIERLFLESWQKGLKSIGLYREGCISQPLPAKVADATKKQSIEGSIPHAPLSNLKTVRDRILVKGVVERPLTRRHKSMTSHFRIDDLEGSLVVGEYEDGTPGELFVSLSRQDAPLRGLMDALCASTSRGLQYGVPLKVFIKEMIGTSYAPFGPTDDPDIPTASSITDYIARRLAIDYLSFDDQLELGLDSTDDTLGGQTSLLEGGPGHVTPGEIAESVPAGPTIAKPESLKPDIVGTPLCYSCGNQTQRAGGFYICTHCGSTTGCS
jgi:ribonucleoside-diphosphate reductase alpha chain